MMQLNLSDHGLGFGDIVVLMLLCLFCASFRRSAEEDKPDLRSLPSHVYDITLSTYLLYLQCSG